MHLDIVQKRLKARYDLEIITHEPKIAYRETLTATADAEYQHKKQSGGRGQYGKVHLRVYPLKDLDIKTEEELLEKFANKSKFEKMRSAHYDPHLQLRASSTTSSAARSPTTSSRPSRRAARKCWIKARSRAIACRMSPSRSISASITTWTARKPRSRRPARMCFKKAFREARPVLLEPIVHLEVTVPSKYTGAILSDLNTKRARVEDQDSLPGDLTVIKAIAPLAEMTRYAAQLGSITQGQGRYTMEFSHYDIVPGNVQQQIVSKAKMTEEEVNSESSFSTAWPHKAMAPRGHKRRRRHFLRNAMWQSVHEVSSVCDALNTPSTFFFWAASASASDASRI